MEQIKQTSSPCLHVAIFQKDGAYGSIGIHLCERFNTVSNIDPRSSRGPARISFGSPAEAVEAFGRYLDTSIANGWRLLHLGSPQLG